MKLTIKISKLLKPLLVISLLTVSSCTSTSEPIPGPDKQGSGLLTGALLGAGSGMITGAQLGAATGPGALIGAAFGAAWGSVSGFGIDLIEEEEIRLIKDIDRLHEEVWAQHSLVSHYERKKDLYPGRDIFPSDEFFNGDGVTLSHGGALIIKALAKRYASLSASSRVQITSYQTVHDTESGFANYLGSRRTQALALEFSSSGLNPRRLVLRSVRLSSPLVIDPYDAPERYSQAVEFSLIDR